MVLLFARLGSFGRMVCRWAGLAGDPSRFALLASPILDPLKCAGVARARERRVWACLPIQS